MNLIRFTPNRSSLPTFTHASLLDELDRLFEVGFPTLRGQAAPFGAFPIDLYQDKETVTVRAELPGFRKEDLDVKVEDDILTITGHVASGDKKAPKTGTTFQRTVVLPEGLDYQKIAAAYENGVLTVTLPKRPEAKPTTVAIEIK
jgi:HSP20 family protein